MSTAAGPAPEASIKASMPRRPSVFLSDFLHIEVPFEHVAPVLLDGEAGWLQQLATTTCADGSAEEDGTFAGSGSVTEAVSSITFRLGFGPRRLRMPVVVSAAEPRRAGHCVIVPIRWDPVQFGRLLPSLEADLELSGYDDSFSRLAISGRYKVPLASVGREVDRAVLHRLAESSARQFLQEIEQVLLAGSGSSEPSLS